MCSRPEIRKGNRKSMKIRVFSLFLSLLAASAAFGQFTSGSISATVVDPQGAAVPQATVNLTNKQTNVSLAATTDNIGRFVFPTVPPGVYDLVVKAAGFKTLERSNLVLQVNERLTLGDMMLSVGEVSEVVEVSAQAMTLLDVVNVSRDLSRFAGLVKAAGVEGVDPLRGPRFSHAEHALQAAADGAGVVLGRLTLAAADIAAGRLLLPFELSLPVRPAYFLVLPKASSRPRRVVAFRDWLLAEAARERGAAA